MKKRYIWEMINKERIYTEKKHIQRKDKYKVNIYKKWKYIQTRDI